MTKNDVSDKPVPVPWENNETIERGGGDFREEEEEHKEQEEEKEVKEEEDNFCGVAECGLVCRPGEFCANTGTACTAYPCCETVECVVFNV